MHKILLIAKRDFIASVRTKTFIFGLIVAPLLFGGSLIGVALTKTRPDIKEKRVAVIDYTGLAGTAIIDASTERNELELFDKTTKRQVMSRYVFEQVPPDKGNVAGQRFALSERVRKGDLFAFVEVGANALKPRQKAGPDAPGDGLAWYSNEGAFGEARRWLTVPFNDGLRRVRLAGLGIEPSQFNGLLTAVPVQSMSLLSRDEKTGELGEGRKKSEAEGFALPIAVTLLLAMIVMTSAGPMLPGIAEDKMQRVYEILLASATPFELIAGKVAAGVGRSLVSSALYIALSLIALNSMTMTGLAPLGLLPWFVAYLIAEVTILCAFATALGAACGSAQDAQSLGVVLLSPVIIPLFFLMPVIQHPNGGLATAMSLFPLFTPLIMLMRQAMPGGVPAWQSWVGLAGTLFGTIAISWIASRIFRVAIMFQGKTPNLAQVIRWGVRG